MDVALVVSRIGRWPPPKRKHRPSKTRAVFVVKHWEEGDLSMRSIAQLMTSYDFVSLLGRPGNDLLSHVLRRSTIGAGAFHGRVRNGIGCGHPAIATRSAEK